MAKGFNRLPVFAGVLLLSVLLAACYSNVPGTSGPIDIDLPQASATPGFTPAETPEATPSTTEDGSASPMPEASSTPQATSSIDASTITPETTAADLGMDSLDVAELLMDIEDNFYVTVEPSPELKTIGDFVKAIEALQ